MFRSLELSDLTLHLEVIDNIFDELLVHISVVNSEGDSWYTESARSSDPMKIDIWVTD